MCVCVCVCERDRERERGMARASLGSHVYSVAVLLVRSCDELVERENDLSQVNDMPYLGFMMCLGCSFWTTKEML